jgi:hypothetical protein
MKDEKIRGIRSFGIHEDNPFHKGSEVLIENKRGAAKWMNEKSVEIRRTTPLTKDDLRRHYFDAAQDFFSFSNNAKNVLIHLDAIAKFKNLTAEVDFEKAKEQTGYNSDQSIFNGMAELLELGFIARADGKNLYHLNPIIFSKNKQYSINHFYTLK